LNDSDPDLNSNNNVCSSKKKQGSTKDKYPMRSYRQVALAGVQEGGQVIEVDLPTVPSRNQPVIHTYLNIVQAKGK